MSDKKLLEEGSIRRFQTLANIKPLGGDVLVEKKAAHKEQEKGAAHEEEKGAPHKKGKHAKKPVTVKENYIEEEEGYVSGQTQAPKTTEEGAPMEEFMGKYEEEGMEEAEGGMEGGEESEVRAALEEIAAGVDKLVKMVGGSVTLGVDHEEGEKEAPEGGEAGEEEAHGEEDEEESLEEMKKAKAGKKVHNKVLKMGGNKFKGAAGLTEAHEEEEEEEEEEESLEETVEMVDTEALAEELTRRVAARLMREAKKGMGGGAPKSAPKAKGSASKSNWGTKKGTKGHA